LKSVPQLVAQHASEARNAAAAVFAMNGLTMNGRIDR
jgi:hypothetical protein